MDRQPLVSMGMPVYNGEKYICRAIDSLLAQDYENFELIISDNASTDATPEICLGYAAKDARIHFYRRERNYGQLANFGFVMERGLGKYFMWAAADDRWLPGFVSALVRELESHFEADVAMCATERVREDGTIFDRVWYAGKNSPSVMTHFRLATALAAGRLYHFYIYGLFRTEFIRRTFARFPKVVGGDRLFVCELALATRFRYVEQLLYIRTVHNQSLAARYAEAEGRRPNWTDRLVYFKHLATVGPYLMSSRVIPWHRKLFVPALMLRFVIFYCHVVGMPRVPVRTLAFFMFSVVPQPLRFKIRQLFGRGVS